MKPNGGPVGKSLNKLCFILVISNLFCMKMRLHQPTILNDPQKKSSLQVELAVVIDVGEQFVKATYSLEGDGPLVFTCFEVLSAVDASSHLPNTSAVIEHLSTISISSQQWLAYARKCVQPGLNYFHKKLH